MQCCTEQRCGSQGLDPPRPSENAILASEPQVARGSIHWHFRDREDLLRRVLQAWREEATVQLTKRLALAHSDARELQTDVATLPLRGRAAVRAARIGYHQSLFQALGFAADEARGVPSCCMATRSPSRCWRARVVPRRARRGAC